MPQSQLPCLALWAIILAVLRIVTQSKLLSTTVGAPGDGCKRQTLQVPETQSKTSLQINSGSAKSVSAVACGT